jgi:hypothetical protein
MPCTLRAHLERVRDSSHSNTVSSRPTACKMLRSGANTWPPKKPRTKRARIASSLRCAGRFTVMDRVSSTVTWPFGFVVDAAFDLLRESGTLALDDIWLVETQHVALRILRTWRIATVDATAAEAAHSLLIDVVIPNGVCWIGADKTFSVPGLMYRSNTCLWLRVDSRFCVSLQTPTCPEVRRAYTRSGDGFAGLKPPAIGVFLCESSKSR